MKNCIHIYWGDGKGKTTAAVGLAVRFAGSGQKVVIAQFLKAGNSSELTILKQIDYITVLNQKRNFGFYWNMTEEEKKGAREEASYLFEQAIHVVSTTKSNLLILDEIIAADRHEFISHKILMDFLVQRPNNLEIVLTGRNPKEDLLELADYSSQINKLKHPYDLGVKARLGIEL